LKEIKEPIKLGGGKKRDINARQDGLVGCRKKTDWNVTVGKKGGKVTVDSRCKNRLRIGDNPRGRGKKEKKKNGDRPN